MTPTQALYSMGFSVWQMGGGCTAFGRLSAARNAEILITYIDGSPLEDDCEVAYIAAYDVNADDTDEIAGKEIDITDLPMVAKAFLAGDYE